MSWLYELTLKHENDIFYGFHFEWNESRAKVQKIIFYGSNIDCILSLTLTKQSVTLMDVCMFACVFHIFLKPVFWNLLCTQIIVTSFADVCPAVSVSRPVSQVLVPGFRSGLTRCVAATYWTTARHARTWHLITWRVSGVRLIHGPVRVTLPVLRPAPFYSCNNTSGHFSWWRKTSCQFFGEKQKSELLFPVCC